MKIRGGILAIMFLVINAGQVKSQIKRQLIWSDEFNYTGLPDSTKWGYEKGLVRNHEPQYYTIGRTENCSVENGCLVIEARKENYKDSKYTSASITTQGKASFQYGRIEMRAKVPKGLGSWSAFWMLGVNHGRIKWPDCGEIDIMEYVGKDSSKVYGTLHYANRLGEYEHQGAQPIVGAPYDGFHIYAVERNKDNICFYYDSIKYLAVDLTKVDKKARKILDGKFYLLINLALGRPGTLGGKLSDGILPLKYYIDYVRVYK
ncbi:hypothetical protein A9P82_04330 [Arachidicoccus ginsenosidimutans]|uniref:glycoside hydrolase family 16 protein n=1 Tax=Arachidicoccus sp. BS20 TaxID=1850526 RepID=UPI0007F0CC9E|nr:glycoside hydrolase family 16 protein [Arachidicoccus sp. BS20]ANI90612.1 hypothetical protein A9P82_04330 [Arachidicoccus sp. BS20]